MARTSRKDALSLASVRWVFVVFTVLSYPALADTPFSCPDDRALSLLAIAMGTHPSNGGFSGPISAYRYVIQNASRQMDMAALRVACSRLARKAYKQNHPEVGKSLSFGFIPPKSAVQNLVEQYPVLANCPVRSLYEDQLPTRRPFYSPPRQAVDLGLTGWVDLKLTISDSGEVQGATIIESSNEIFEAGVVDHVLKFRYSSSYYYPGKLFQRNGFILRIETDYFSIAKARGCEWEHPSWGVSF